MQPLKTSKIALQGANILTPNGWVDDATVLVQDGRFISIDQDPKPTGYVALDVSGLLMLPGIVDIHGDAFERIIVPRPGVNIPLAMAMVENDRNLLASGITTFYYSITDSFEPGLRSRDMARQLINFIMGEERKALTCESYIHLRHEQCNIAHYQELVDWLETGKIQLLSLNDHVPYSMTETALDRYTKGVKKRTKLSEHEIQELITNAIAYKDRGLEQVEKLVKFAHEVGVTLASHDDDSEEKVNLSATRKVAIAEFPSTIDLAAKSRDYGASVLMGAPNFVRGGSHVGYMSVEAATKAEVLDCLCSDYHYPSMFYVPFKMAEIGLTSFENAWKFVSENPAKAANIGHIKGSIAPNYQADFLLVSPDNYLPNAIKSVYINGQEVAKYQ